MPGAVAIAAVIGLGLADCALLMLRDRANEPSVEATDVAEPMFTDRRVMAPAPC
jgi:hypothetical protein